MLVTSEGKDQVSSSHEAGLDAGHLGQLDLEAPHRSHVDTRAHSYIEHPELLAHLPNGIQCSEEGSWISV